MRKLTARLEPLVTADLSSLGYLRSVTVQMNEGQHDVVVLRMTDSSVGALQSVTGSPATFTWSHDNIRSEIVGYLDTTSPHLARAGLQESDSIIYLLAATYVMRDSTQRVWRNATPLVIASDVVAPHRLALEVDEYETPLSFMSQTGGESDWAFLQRLAAEIGFSLVGNGVVVRLVDPLREARRALGRDTPTYVLPSTPRYTTNVDRFTVRQTDTPTAEGGLVDRIMHGHTADGTEFTYSSEYAFAKITPGYTAKTIRPSERTYRSLGDAMVDAERIARMARWASVATLELPGDPRLRVGQCVALSQPYGPHSGLWYVVEARHDLVLNPESYKTMLTICREAPEVSRRLVPLPQQIGQRKNPAPLLTPNNEWQSSRELARTT